MDDRPQHPDSARLIEEDATELYDEAPCGYLYCRPDGTILRVNRTFLQWTGFERAAVIGRRFQDMLSIGGRIFHETHLAPLLHMQGAVTEIALDVVTRDGALLPVLVNSVQKRDETGAPVLVRTTVFNASERRKYERELQRARARAEESARVKSELLSTISHDIRSPIGAILGAAQLLEKSELPPKQQTFVRVLRSSSETLLNLVNSVLDLGRIESGRAALERRPFDLRQLILDVMAVQNVHADRKGLSLRVAIADALPSTLSGDPVKVGQIITNLLSNAVKFTERGSVELTVRIVDASADRVRVEFTVADTGIGIPADRLPHVFEEFTQGSYDVGATYGGAGLGLTIVRRLIDLHGSRMRVDSEVGKGTTFSFALDFDVMPDQRSATDIGSDDAIARADLLNGVSALVVEENAFDAFVLGRALASWGVAYDVCSTVADGAARLRTKRYDAVLLATRAEQQELESASAALIGAVPPSHEPPQVLALARSASEAARLSAAGGVAAVLPKPVDTSVLFAKLASSSGL